MVAFFYSQSTYINRVLKRFKIIGAHLLSTPTVSCSNKGNNLYRLCDEEEISGKQYLHLVAVGASLYLATARM